MAVTRAFVGPSLGFIGLTIVYVSAMAFAACGFSTPRLDRVWLLQHEFRTGKVSKLDSREHAILEQALLDHPSLAKALLPRGDIGIVSANQGGWIETPFVTLVRTADAKTNVLLVNVETSPEHLPFTIDFESNHWRHSIEVISRKEYRVELPTDTGRPAIITAQVKGKRFKADPAILGIQLHFEGEEQWQASEVEEQDDEE